MFKFKSTPRFRSQLLIDHRVQVPILQRTALYTGSCAVYFMVVLLFSESTEYGHESASRTLRECLDVFACWAPGLTLLFPIIAYDILIFSNRIVGPLYRLRLEMQRLIDHESVQPVKLRDNDYWQELASLFNQIQAEVVELRGARKSSGSLFGAANANKSDDLGSQSISTKGARSAAELVAAE